MRWILPQAEAFKGSKIQPITCPKSLIVEFGWDSVQLLFFEKVALMNLFRRNRRSIASQVLALLTVVWLNLALAPCAMSMGTQLGEKMNSHMSASTMDHAVMDHSMMDQEPPCSHCPPEQSHCDTDLSGPCALEAQVSSDSALTNLTLDHHSPGLALTPVVVEFMPPVGKQLEAPPPDIGNSVVGVSLQKRFCVYLK